jgi:transcriptional regulator with XRE-family HTH domain
MKQQFRTIQEIQVARAAAGIPAIALARCAQINRSKLSYLERGYTQPTADELKRLQTALRDMIHAKSAALLAMGDGAPAVEAAA